MKKVLVFAGVAEAFTGLALLVVPSLVAQLLLGQQLAGGAIPVARVTGIALFALGISCWPATPLLGMFTYSSVVTLYLTYIGLEGEFSGILPWPAAVVTPFCQSFSVVLCWLLKLAASSVGCWPFASFRCCAAIASLQEHTGHQLRCVAS